MSYPQTPRVFRRNYNGNLVHGCTVNKHGDNHYWRTDRPGDRATTLSLDEGNAWGLEHGLPDRACPYRYERNHGNGSFFRVGAEGSRYEAELPMDFGCAYCREELDEKQRRALDHMHRDGDRPAYTECGCPKCRREEEAAQCTMDRGCDEKFSEDQAMKMIERIVRKTPSMKGKKVNVTEVTESEA